MWVLICYMVNRLSQVRAELLKSPRTRVLDVGAGTGEYWRYMSPTSSVVAVEPNPHLRETLLRNAQKAPCHVDVSKRPARGQRSTHDDIPIFCSRVPGEAETSQIISQTLSTN